MMTINDAKIDNEFYVVRSKTEYRSREQMFVQFLTQYAARVCEKRNFQLISQ